MNDTEYRIVVERVSNGWIAAAFLRGPTPGQLLATYFAPTRQDAFYALCTAIDAGQVSSLGFHRAD